MLVLLTRGIYDVCYWDGLKWLEKRTTFYDYQFWQSNNIKVMAATIWGAAASILLIGATCEGVVELASGGIIHIVACKPVPGKGARSKQWHGRRCSAPSGKHTSTKIELLLGKHVPAGRVTNATGETGWFLRGPLQGVRKKRIAATSFQLSVGSWVLQGRLRRDGAVVQCSAESQPVNRRLGGWCEMVASLRPSLLRQEFCTGGCEERTWAHEGGESPLLKPLLGNASCRYSRLENALQVMCWFVKCGD
jgi:hypothetical protein